MAAVNHFRFQQDNVETRLYLLCQYKFQTDQISFTQLDIVKFICLVVNHDKLYLSWCHIMTILMLFLYYLIQYFFFFQRYNIYLLSPCLDRAIQFVFYCYIIILFGHDIKHCVILPWQCSLSVT